MGKQSKPISPDVAKLKFYDNIPDIIIDAVNALIIKNYNPNTNSSTVKKKDIVNAVIGDDDIKESTIYDNHWLDFEPLYRAEGWDVEFDSPDWDEHYDSFYKFSIKKK